MTALAETLADPAAALLAERVTGTGRPGFASGGFNSALALDGGQEG